MPKTKFRFNTQSHSVSSDMVVDCPQRLEVSSPTLQHYKYKQ